MRKMKTNISQCYHKVAIDRYIFFAKLSGLTETELESILKCGEEELSGLVIYRDPFIVSAKIK